MHLPRDVTVLHPGMMYFQSFAEHVLLVERKG
jgi:hypothetical protein